jgi:2-haloacid dehalogenase
MTDPHTNRPVLVFDVNETLLDITVLAPIFERVFGNADSLREWFAQLILYSEAISLSGGYTPFNVLAAGVFRMLGKTKGVGVQDADIEALSTAMATLPALPDVYPALSALKQSGYRLVTLSNSPPGSGESPLMRAGLAEFFEKSFSVHTVERFKPHPDTYQQVAEALDVSPSALCMVACHVWDTIGAGAAGWQTVLVRRAGNAEILAPGVRHPDWIVDDLNGLLEIATSEWT